MNNEVRKSLLKKKKKDINGLVIPLTDEEKDFCIKTAKEACIDEKWDELLKTTICG